MGLFLYEGLVHFQHVQRVTSVCMCTGLPSPGGNLLCSPLPPLSASSALCCLLWGRECSVLPGAWHGECVQEAFLKKKKKNLLGHHQPSACTIDEKFCVFLVQIDLMVSMYHTGTFLTQCIIHQNHCMAETCGMTAVAAVFMLYLKMLGGSWALGTGHCWDRKNSCCKTDFAGPASGWSMDMSFSSCSWIASGKI